MEKYISRRVEDTQQIAARIANELKAGDIIALSGELGAGKTAFVTGLARALGSMDPVTSPTFTLVNEYQCNGVMLYHFDVYRLENPDTGEREWLDEYLFGDGISVIEWAENIHALLPDEHIRIEIKKSPVEGDDYREVILC